MARVFPICSSSEGNCTFIGTRGHGILVDAGCSFRALKNALSLIDTDLGGIEAVFITHEHYDHIKGMEQLFKHTALPVFASGGTIAAMAAAGRIPDGRAVYNINETGYKSASFEVRAFGTSHDAAESVGYRIDFNGQSFAVCTDTGVVTDAAEKALAGCETVLLESNYDPDMLRRNMRYSFDLKRRISSNIGHLSNRDCAEFAERLVRGGTKHLILGHLSKENNTPDTAFGCVSELLAKRGLVVERDFTLDVAPVVTEGTYIAV